MHYISSGNWKMQRQCWLQTFLDTKIQKQNKEKRLIWGNDWNVALTSNEMEKMEDRDVKDRLLRSKKSVQRIERMVESQY